MRLGLWMVGLLLWGQTSLAQLPLDTVIFSPHYFESLEEALKYPDSVWYLDLSLQKLKVLPPEIGKLKNLRILNIAFNHFTSLPETIGELENLEILDISGNYALHRLPASLSKLRKLREIYVIDHRFPPGEIAKLKSWFPNAKIYLRVEDLPNYGKRPATNKDTIAQPQKTSGK